MPGVEDATMVDTIGREKTRANTSSCSYGIPPIKERSRPTAAVSRQGRQLYQIHQERRSWSRNSRRCPGLPVTIINWILRRNDWRRRRCSIELVPQIQGHGIRVELFQYDPRNCRILVSGALGQGRAERDGHRPPRSGAQDGPPSAGLRRTRRWISCSRPHGINHDCGLQLTEAWT